MIRLHATPKTMQAAEREEDYQPRNAAANELFEPSNNISTIDPVTGNDVGALEGKPSLVDGDLTLYFESEHTRQMYLDAHKNLLQSLPVRKLSGN